MTQKRYASRSLLATALAAFVSTTGLVGGAAMAQAPTFQTFGLSGNVQEQTDVTGYQGSVKVTCESNPAQSAEGIFPTVGGVTSGQSAQLSCKGDYRIEGQIWKDPGSTVTCTPYRFTEASDTGMNNAMFRSVTAQGSNVRCAMTAGH